MSELVRLPKFEEDLADFVGGLRSRVFSSKLDAARYFNLTRSTASRYESGHLKPPLGYLVSLAQLNLEKLIKQSPEIEPYRQYLMREINKVLRWHYREEYLTGKSFHSWAELAAIAQTYQTERAAGGTKPTEAAANNITRREDWGEATLESSLYGRETELATLEKWLTQDRTRLVIVNGLGGIGKTALVNSLSLQLKPAFECVIWRSLRHAPAINDVLTDCLRFLSGQADLQPPPETAKLIGLVVEWLQKNRCLLVLDNFETVLQGATQPRRYLPDYAGYGELLSRVAGNSHQSSLIITTREKPPQSAELPDAHTLILSGLINPAGQQILADYGLQGSAELFEQLVQRYTGSPLALKLVAATIKELFGGEIADFLQENQFTLADVTRLLDQQFDRLTVAEQNVMYWLAVGREPLTLSNLQESLCLPPLSKKELLATLYSLRERAVLETEKTGFTQQPVVMEYVTERLVDLIAQELAAGELELLRRVALSQATGKHYLRTSQLNLILHPLLNRLEASWSTKANQEHQLLQLVARLRQQPRNQQGYAGGNLANLLRLLTGSLAGYDFSNLNLRQANFQNISLQNANFSGADLNQAVFSEFFDGICCVAIDSHSERVAAGSLDGYIYIWNMREAKTCASFKGHQSQVNSIAFSADGKLLASASSDQTVKLWDVCTGQELATLNRHTNWVWTVAFSPDGQLLASAGSDKVINLWAIAPAASAGVPQTAAVGNFSYELVGHASTVRAVAFSPDGNFLASAGGEQQVRIWEVATGKTLQILAGHSGWIQAVAFSPDGNFLASVGEDKLIHLWQRQADGIFAAYQKLSGHSRWVWAVAFSPDSKFLASSSDDCTIRVWEVASGQCWKMLDESASVHSGAVQGVVFSSDGKFLVSGSADRSVKFWDMESGHCWRTLQGYSNSVKAAALSQDGQHLVAACDGGRGVALWDLAEQQNRANMPQPEIIRSLAINPQATAFVTGDEAGNVNLWWENKTAPLAGLPKFQVKSIKGHTSWVQTVVYSQNGQLLASAGGDKIIQLWQVHPEIHNFRLNRSLVGHTEWIWNLSFSGDSQRLVSAGGKDRTLRIWATNNGNCLQTIQDKSSWALAVALNRDGRRLASGGDDGSVRLWNVEEPAQPWREWSSTGLGHVWAVALSADESWLAAGGENGIIKVWAVESGVCRAILQGHRGWVRSVSFRQTPESELELVSASEDGTLRIWQLATESCRAALESQRLYQGLCLTNATGLSEAQLNSLLGLGAQL